MPSVNKVILIGNLGDNPVLRKTNSDKSVVSFSIATSESWRNKNGEKQTDTQWHRIVIFGNLADIANQYLKKGSQIYIEGKVTYRSWEKDGQKHYKTEIIANQIQFLGEKKDSAPAQTNNHQPSAPSYSAQPDEYGNDVSDDDLPF